MRSVHAALLTVMLAMPPALLADTLSAHSNGHRDASAIDIPESALAAVAAVDRFSAALAAGRIDEAGAELAADVLVLESGGAERSAAEYLSGHAGDDAEFLKSARVELIKRRARVDGDLAWVGSESEIRTSHDGKPVVLLSTETMVLQRRDGAWKILHIHWSSRRAGAG